MWITEGGRRYHPFWVLRRSPYFYQYHNKRVVRRSSCYMMVSLIHGQAGHVLLIVCADDDL